MAGFPWTITLYQDGRRASRTALHLQQADTHISDQCGAWICDWMWRHLFSIHDPAATRCNRRRALIRPPCSLLTCASTLRQRFCRVSHGCERETVIQSVRPPPATVVDALLYLHRRLPRRGRVLLSSFFIWCHPKYYYLSYWHTSSRA